VAVAVADKVGAEDAILCSSCGTVATLCLEEAHRWPPTLQPWSALVREELRRCLLPYAAELTAVD
jgi:hypothetical protein